VLGSGKKVLPPPADRLVAFSHLPAHVPQSVERSIPDSQRAFYLIHFTNGTPNSGKEIPVVFLNPS
jgi:hypothetical protein